MARTRERRCGWWILLALFAALLAAWPIGAAVEPRGLDAPAASFSAERVTTWLRTRGPLEPRPGGVEAHARFRGEIVRELERLGLEVDVQEALGRGPGGRIALVRNVVARQFADAPGTSVLLAAHYDSVGCSPGAADDAAGCASLLEIARALGSAPPLDRSIVYLFSDAEEAGLIGAETFARSHPWSRDVGCVVNLEARGSHGPSVVIQARGGSGAIDALANSGDVRASSLADFVYKLMPNDTDYSVFDARGVPGFNLAFFGGLWSYHTPSDDLERLDLGSVQHQGDVALALARELGDARFEEWSDERLVFTDLPGIGIVRWNAWIGVLAAAAVAWFTARRARAEDMNVLRGIAAASPGVSAASALAFLVVWAEFAALGWRLESADAGARDPNSSALSITFTTTGAFALAAGLLNGSLGFRRTWIALGGSLGVFALAASLLLAQISFLVLLPALAWCVLELALRPNSVGRAAVSLVALAALGLVLFVPVRAQLVLALSFRFPVALAAPSVAVLAIAWPAFGWIERRRLRALGGAMIAAGLLCLLLVKLKVPGGFQGVEWLNLRHATDAESGTARFEASTFGAALPHEVAKAAPWELATTPPFPWMSLDRSMFVAPAPPLHAPPPVVEVLNTETIAGGRRLRVRVRSPRRAPRLHLHLPASVSIEAVEWRGQRLDDSFEGVDTQLLFAFEEDGVDFVLVDRAEEPSTVHVIDQDWSWSADHQWLRELRPSHTHIPRSDGDIVFVGARCELR